MLISIMSSKIAMFPGSFDPIHEGHIDIIKRSSKLFEKLYVVVSYNVDKTNQSNLLNRYQLAKNAIDRLKLKNVIVLQNSGLTIEFAKKHHCQYIVRSIRNHQDYDYELDMAQVHHAYDNSIETILFIAAPELNKTSSTNIKLIRQKLKDLQK